MSIRDNLQRDLDTFFDERAFAQKALYIDAQGNQKEVSIIFRTKSDLAIEDMHGLETTIPAALCKRSEIPQVKHDDLLTIDGVNYRVSRIELLGEWIYKLYLSKDERPLF